MPSKKNATPPIVCLRAIFLTGGMLALAGCAASRPVEIILTETTSTLPATQVYIGGAVNNPGLYPLMPGDGLDSLIRAAGGLSTPGPDRIEIYLPGPGEVDAPQKIDINRAPAWLLEALPGIGEVTAQAIIDYRQQNGPFRSIDDLLKVKGIGETTLKNIAGFITVSEHG